MGQGGQRTQPYVKDWKAFARKVRATREALLPELKRFPDAILVTGCQRSGGTMLSRLLTGSEGLTNFWFSRDEELDAAQILAGVVDYDAPGRHCFQTTYLNERWREYLDPSLNFRMVWTLRNPHSVVYSMVHNWRRFALNEVFLACGFAHMDARDRVRFQRFGIWGIPPVRRAAYAYVGKLAQLEPLAQALGNRLTVVEYDRLVARKSDVLPQLYERLNLRYQPHYVDGVSDRSVRKQDMLRQGDRAEIAVRCDGAYRQACSLLNLGTSS